MAFHNLCDEKTVRFFGTVHISGNKESNLNVELNLGSFPTHLCKADLIQHISFLFKHHRLDYIVPKKMPGHVGPQILV